MLRSATLAAIVRLLIWSLHFVAILAFMMAHFFHRIGSIGKIYRKPWVNGKTGALSGAKTDINSEYVTVRRFVGKWTLNTGLSPSR